MRERQGFVLVYDVTNPASVDYVTRLHDEILQNKSDGNTDAPTVIPTVLVGNKVDLRTKKSVSHYRGEQLSEKLECPFYETSAIENINTDVVFHDVVRQIIDMKEMFRRMKLKVVRGRLEVV